jgi:hypothetical protein
MKRQGSSNKEDRRFFSACKHSFSQSMKGSKEGPKQLRQLKAFAIPN